MSNILLLNRPFINIGLGTLTYTIPSTGFYSVAVALTEVPPSGVSVLVKDNSSTVFTAPVITPTQIAQQFKFSRYFTSGHTVDVVIDSSEDIDDGLNNVKAQVIIEEGF